LRYTTSDWIERPCRKSWKVRIPSDNLTVKFRQDSDSETVIQVLHFKIAFRWMIYSLHDLFFRLPRGLWWYPYFLSYLPRRFVLFTCRSISGHLPRAPCQH
jgi:hypothetical protein